MSAPKRIQLRRTRGWRKPEGAIVVARPSKWGNWFKVQRARTGTPAPDGHGYARDGLWLVVQVDKWGFATGPQWGAWEDKAEALAFAVQLHRHSLLATRADLDGRVHHEHYLGPLRGHDLACWCPLDQPCHADVLLELANQ